MIITMLTLWWWFCFENSCRPGLPLLNVYEFRALEVNESKETAPKMKMYSTGNCLSCNINNSWCDKTMWQSMVDPPLTHICPPSPPLFHSSSSLLSSLLVIFESENSSVLVIRAFPTKQKMVKWTVLIITASNQGPVLPIRPSMKPSQSVWSPSGKSVNKRAWPRRSKPILRGALIIWAACLPDTISLCRATPCSSTSWASMRASRKTRMDVFNLAGLVLVERVCRVKKGRIWPWNQFCVLLRSTQSREGFTKLSGFWSNLWWLGVRLVCFCTPWPTPISFGLSEFLHGCQIAGVMKENQILGTARCTSLSLHQKYCNFLCKLPTYQIYCLVDFRSKRRQFQDLQLHFVWWHLILSQKDFC